MSGALALERPWTVHLLTRRDTTYGDSGIIPVLHLENAVQLWELWDGGLAAMLAIVLEGKAEVITGGAALYGAAVFERGKQPLWEANEAVAVRYHLQSVAEALEHLLLAVAATASRPIGLRLLRGRSDGHCRAEYWLPSGEAGPWKAVVAAHAQLAGAVAS